MTQNNPFADAFKAFDAFKSQIPSVDLNEISAAGQRNLENAAAAGKAAASAIQEIANGSQAIAKLQFEIAQKNAENAIKLFKEVANSKDPKEAAAKQADSVKEIVEKSIADASKIAEIASKSNSKACEIVGEQVKKNIQGFSAPCCSGASSAKKPTKAA